MDLAVFGGRILLAAVFAISAIAKLADRRGVRAALVDFGVPAPLITPASAILPVAESVVALALLSSSSARWGAVGALALLVIFSAAIAVNLVRGRQPECHCFGQLRSGPVGTSTLVRNGLLATLAGGIAWRQGREPGFSMTDWLAQKSAGEILGFVAAMVALALVALQAWFILHLIRQHGRLLVRMEVLEGAIASGSTSSRSHEVGGGGLPAGTKAPEFDLPGLHGETLTLAALRSAGQPVLLLFTAPGCGPCESLMPEVGSWQRDHSSVVTIGIISAGPADAIGAIAAEHGLRNVLRQEGREVAESYHYLGTPSAVVVSPDGRIATPLVAGADPIRSLFIRTLSGSTAVPVEFGRGHADGHDRQHHASPPAPAVGDPAPSVQLRDLEGRSHDLAEFLDGPTLVLFWDPACGFCERMLGDLKAWENRPPKGAPKLLVVSTGSAETNRAMGLRSPVLVDQHSQAMKTFGANGTPIGILVDSGARIASPLAVGAPAVLALAQGTGGGPRDEPDRRGMERTRDG
jgi:peroxiredoxin